MGTLHRDFWVFFKVCKQDFTFFGGGEYVFFDLVTIETENSVIQKFRQINQRNFSNCELVTLII